MLMLSVGELLVLRVTDQDIPTIPRQHQIWPDNDLMATIEGGLVLAREPPRAREASHAVAER